MLWFNLFKKQTKQAKKTKLWSFYPFLPVSKLSILFTCKGNNTLRHFNWLKPWFGIQDTGSSSAQPILCYADDIRICIPRRPGDPESRATFRMSQWCEHLCELNNSLTENFNCKFALFYCKVWIAGHPGSKSNGESNGSVEVPLCSHLSILWFSGFINSFREVLIFYSMIVLEVLVCGKIELYYWQVFLLSFFNWVGQKKSTT